MPRLPPNSPFLVPIALRGICNLLRCDQWTVILATLCVWDTIRNKKILEALPLASAVDCIAAGTARPIYNICVTTVTKYMQYYVQTTVKNSSRILNVEGTVEREAYVSD